MKPWLFWIIPILLFIAQLIFTLNSTSQIRYEELAESVRNPFWLENRLIYDGTSSNIGWYGSLLIVYKIFGFGLFHAKYFRLFLHLISMVCLALVLRRFLSPKQAIVPLLVIGLSPSLLFLNTLETSYGTDLQYFPICLFLILSSKIWLRLLGCFIAMIAWMSYPTFLFYLPVLAFLNLRHLRSLRYLSFSLGCFFAPLILGFLYLKSREILFFDPNLSSGIFRGAGTFAFNVDALSANLGGLFKDLFNAGQSYHFEINSGEFSLIFPIIAVILVFIIVLKKRNKWIILSLVSMVFVLFLSSLTLDPSGQPGMRRYTPVLVAFYALFVIAWQSGVFKKWGMVILSLLLLHHLIVYPINLIHLKDPSPNAYPIWFTPSPSGAGFNSFDSLVDTVQKEDLKLVCSGYCRVVEAYAAVAGTCTWNHLNCHQILGLDPRTNQLIPLSTQLWDDYYFEH